MAVLGNGKSDNQNHAIIFSRGAVIQAIDANQDGYIEESLKLPSALREFEPRDSQPAPAIVGFREHIFSGLGALGAFAASSETVFGGLAQRTMADLLHSRYHYGHPDLLDKCKMISQGGISKATRGLNLSEDIFAGMDAMLRGHRVVHREYYQVGKGRDMGFLSILGFFSKLSSGTAQMSTSRQAYRLGVRLGTARLLGFFYAHTGYYLGQLHFYHAAYLAFAFGFVGALADGCGLLSGIDFTALLSRLYGPLYILFLAGSLLPLQLALLYEQGVRAALCEPLRQLLAGSPLFFAVQSRCIAHYLSGEFASGGAAYIPTGRSLAIERQPFSALFKSFAPICFYPGLELGLFLGLMALANPSMCARVSTATWLTAAVMPVALLFGPAVFNPRCFELRLGLADARAWLAWLTDGGWAAYHEGLHERKTGSAAYAILLPSKEMLLAFPLLTIAHEVIRPHLHVAFRLPVLGLIATPALPALAVALITPLRRLAHRRRPGGASAAEPPRLQSRAAEPPDRPWSIPRTALLCAAVIAAEVVALAVAAPSIPRAGWISLISARFFAWRALCNSLAHLPLQHTRQHGHGALGLIGHTVAAIAFACDAVLGLALQLPVLAIAAVPYSAVVHLSCLFYTTRDTLEASNKLHAHGQMDPADYERELAAQRQRRLPRWGSGHVSSRSLPNPKIPQTTSVPYKMPAAWSKPNLCEGGGGGAIGCSGSSEPPPRQRGVHPATTTSIETPPLDPARRPARRPRVARSSTRRLMLNDAAREETGRAALSRALGDESSPSSPGTPAVLANGATGHASKAPPLQV